MNSKVTRASIAAGILLLGLAGSFFAKNHLSHRFVVKAYFGDARGLREGAPVRATGLDVGSVRSIHLRIDPKTPVEVVMGLDPKYAPKIPNDSKALLTTAGVLGETYVVIDIASASGPPLQTNGVLKSVEGPEISWPEMIKNLQEALSKKCPCADQPSNSPGTKGSASSSKSSVSRH